MDTSGIIGPFFFENDCEVEVTENSERYRGMLYEFLWPKLNGLNVSELWFLQDGTTSHTRRETIALIATKFDDRIIARNFETIALIATKFDNRIIARNSEVNSPQNRAI